MAAKVINIPGLRNSRKFASFIVVDLIGKMIRKFVSRKFTREDITLDFFSQLTYRQISIRSYKKAVLGDNGGIINKIAAWLTSGMTGLYAFDLYVDTKGSDKVVPTVLKLKSKYNCINDFGQLLAFLSGVEELPRLMEKHRSIFGFEDSSTREIEIYNRVDKRMLKYLPKVYGTLVDEEKQTCCILMERFSDRLHTHTDTIDRPWMWGEESIKIVLDGMADIHSVYFNRTHLCHFDTIVSNTAFDYIKAKELLRTMTLYNADRFPGLINDKTAYKYMDFLKCIGSNIKTMREFPSTLIHNDFNPRNICLKEDCSGRKLVVYDWELACIQNPQHDLAEFLVFSLPEIRREEVIRYIDYYIGKLQEATSYKVDRQQFYEVLRLNLLELAVVRFNLYLYAHGIMRFSFIERAYANLTRLIDIFDKRSFDIQ